MNDIGSVLAWPGLAYLILPHFSSSNHHSMTSILRHGANTGNHPYPSDVTIELAADDSSHEIIGEEEPFINTKDNNIAQSTNHINEKPQIDQIRLLCFNLTSWSAVPRFIFLSLGVFLFFMLNSWVEEYTFKKLPRFEFGWYLTFFELICFSAFAVFERFLNKVSNVSNEGILSHNAHYNRHLIVAVAMTASRGLTNVSLQYLNYPTQVIFKSMKLITVMIGSLFILNNKFSVGEYVSAITLVVSACFFSFGDMQTNKQAMANANANAVQDPYTDPSIFTTGIIIVTLSLVADAIHSNTQESLLKQHKASTSEAMLFTNFFSAILSLIVVITKGELGGAIDYCTAYPIAYILFIFRALVIYGGVLCFVTLIKSNGVVLATTVTTVRKILSILLSFVLFPKPFNDKHGLGVVIFCASVVIAIYDQRHRQKQQAARPR
jgi:adenosine 3'-phospho 5'-phosphosulfate transporter B3